MSAIREFVSKHNGQVFRVWEKDKTDIEAFFVKITDAVEIPGDIFLELMNVEGEEGYSFMYYRLSEIHFERYISDSDDN